MDAITFAFGNQTSPAAALWPFADPQTYADKIDEANKKQAQDPTGGQNIWHET